MAFKTWSAGEVLSAADLNGNFALAVRTDAAKTISVSHIWNAAQKFADGSAAAPIVAFNDDADTGLFRQGANAIGIAAGGSEVARITTNGLRGGDIGEGTVADARLSNNVPLIDTANLFTDVQRVERASETNDVFRARAAGDAQFRFTVNAKGTLGWGDGSATPDTNLYRSAADTLKTDDAFVAAGSLAWGGGSAISSSDDVNTTQNIISEGWEFTNVPADDSDNAMDRVGGTMNAFFIAPRAGSLITIAGNLSGTISAGTITLEVLVNGSASGFTLQFDSGDGADPIKTATAAAGTHSVSAGDTIRMQVTGSGTLVPATVDVLNSVIEMTES